MKMLNNLRRILILTDPIHAAKVAELDRKDKSLVIAFSVDGKVELERRGIKCYFPDDLITLPDLNEMGCDNFQLVRDVCEVIDNKLKERFPFLQQNRIDLFGNGFFIVKVFFDSLCSSFLVLERLFQKIGDQDVVLFSSGGELGKIAEGKCSLVPSLIEHVFLKDYPAIKILPENNCSFNCIRHDGYKSYFALLRLCVQTWFRKYSGATYKSTAIALDNRYDVKILIDDVLMDTDFFKIFMFRHIIAMKALHSRCLTIKMLSGYSGVNKTIYGVFQKIADELADHKIFRGNSGLGRFAFLCLEQYLTKSLGKILRQGGDIKAMFSEMAPAFLCTSSCRIDLKEAFVLGIAKSLGIPVVTHQEGGGAGYLDWPLFNLDSELSDFFLVYGTGVAESPYIKKGIAKVIPVGSLYLDHVKKNISATNKASSPPGIYVILDNLKPDVWQHYPHNGGYFSQAYRHQLKIIEALKKVSKGVFVLKTVKGREHLYASMIDMDKAMRIETKLLSFILHNASAFVLEYPSTVLQECLLTDKPIALLLNGTNVRFDGCALELLERRVRVASEYDEFPSVLEALIEDVRQGNPMTKNKDFLMNYCLMENSRENVDNFFRSIINQEVSAQRN